MPQPRDLTGSIHKSKKLKSRTPDYKENLEEHGRLRMRNLKFSTFSFSVGLIVVIAVLGQFFLMSLFNWI
jgi:hypothetical protein